MSNTKNTIGLVVVALIAIIGLFTPFGQKTIGDVTKAISVTTNLPSMGLVTLAVGNGCGDANSMGTCTGTNGSATSGTISQGGVVTVAKRATMLTASTTPCSIAYPTGATSTLISFNFNVTQSTSTALVFSIATSSSQYSTTTANSSPFATTTLAANTLGAFTWDPGYPTGMMAGTSSSAWVVLGVSGGTAGTVFTTTLGNIIGGTCSATFMSY